MILHKNLGDLSYHVHDYWNICRQASSVAHSGGLRLFNINHQEILESCRQTTLLAMCLLLIITCHPGKYLDSFFFDPGTGDCIVIKNFHPSSFLGRRQQK